MMYLTMVPIYGYMVRAGKYVIDKKDAKEGQRVVPECYAAYVCDWLVEHDDMSESGKK